MSRIFQILSAFSLGFLLLALATGLWLLSGDIRDPADLDAQRAMKVHRLSGLGSGMAVLLANSIVVTYFIGTSRWCREVSDTYKLGPAFIERSARLKRRTFPASLASMAAIIGIATLGAAADPMTGTRPPASGLGWGDLHLLAVVVGAGVMGCAAWVQNANVAAHHRVILDVLDQVARIRAEQGWDAKN